MVKLDLVDFENALKSDLKKPRIRPIWGQSHLLWSQTYHPWFNITLNMTRLDPFYQQVLVQPIIMS